MPPFNPIIQPAAPEVQAADHVTRRGNAILAAATRDYLNTYNLVWNNRTATPDKIIAALGKQAAQVFERAGALAVFLNSQGANVPATSPNTWHVTINADGSATATPTSTSSSGS